MEDDRPVYTGMAFRGHKGTRIRAGRREFMNRSRFTEIALIVGSSVATLLLLSGAAIAQTVKVEGLINGRSGDAMTLQTSDSPKLVVELTDDTQVAQVQGVFKARRKKMTIAALPPAFRHKSTTSLNTQTRS